MRRVVFSFLTVLLYFCRSSSCAALASVTVLFSPKSSHSAQPSPTPTLPALQNLEARNDKFCGYFSGDAAQPYICASDKKCLLDDANGALGCVPTGTGGTTLGAVFTTCLNYNDYTNGLCYSLGPQTGCCEDARYPACNQYSYTGSPFNGYSMMKCVQDANSPGVILAWAASTSGPSSYTITDAAPDTDASISTETTASSTSTPSPTPTNPPQGLSMSDKITLGTALGLGLPATIAGIIAAWYTYRARERKKKSAILENDDKDALIRKSSGDNSGDSPGSSKPFIQRQITTRFLGKYMERSTW